MIALDIKADEMKASGKKTRKCIMKDDKNRTYFTKNNSRFVTRKIPTLEEMIVERNYYLQPKHAWKLHTSWKNVLPEDIDLPRSFQNGSKKSIPHGQVSPSTVSFATLYKATSTAKSALPTPYEKNAYHKYIVEQKRLAEKCQNIEEEQLERLEKENEEAIIKIAEKFCEKVKSWDEEDKTVAEALQSLNPVESTGGNVSDTIATSTAQQESMEKLAQIQDLSHLKNPDWVSNLFRICFGSPWSDGFKKVMRESEGQSNVCRGLGIPVEEMRRQRIKVERVEADKALSKEASQPRVAFGTAVPRAKGLDDFDQGQKMGTRIFQQTELKKQQDEQMDLVTMRAVWGNQLAACSTKHYCKHLRELIQQKVEGAADMDPSLSAINLSQMKPKVLLEAGLLSLNCEDTYSMATSLSSTSS